MAQSCAEYLTVQDLQAILESAPEYSWLVAEGLRRRGKIWQGAMAAKAADDFLREQYEFQKTEYEPQYHGFDNVYTDKQNNFVLMESKSEATLNRPHLTKSKDHGRQLDTSNSRWLAQQMQDSNSEYYTPKNAELGSKIEKAIDDGKVRFIAVNTNTVEKEIRAWERTDEKWELSKSINFNK